MRVGEDNQYVGNLAATLGRDWQAPVACRTDSPPQGGAARFAVPDGSSIRIRSCRRRRRRRRPLITDSDRPALATRRLRPLIQHRRARARPRNEPVSRPGSLAVCNAAFFNRGERLKMSNTTHAIGLKGWENEPPAISAGHLILVRTTRSIWLLDGIRPRGQRVRLHRCRD